MSCARILSPSGVVRVSREYSITVLPAGTAASLPRPVKASAGCPAGGQGKEPLYRTGRSRRGMPDGTHAGMHVQPPTGPDPYGKPIYDSTPRWACKVFFRCFFVILRKAKCLKPFQSHEKQIHRSRPYRYADSRPLRNDP